MHQIEEEDLTMTPEEEAIRAYLADDESLPAEVLEKLLPEWWRQEPFKYVS